MADFYEEGHNATPKEKRMNKVVYLALAVIAAAIGLMLYWSLANENVLEVKNTPVPIRTIRQHPEAEGVVILKVNYCKNTDATGRGRTSFVSASREIFLPQYDDKQAKGCNDVELPVLIPKDIPAGTYKLRFRIVYNLNPLKNAVVEEFDSQPFEVVPHGEQNKAIQ